MPASTHTAHVDKPYTKPRGIYVTTLQQYRSHFRAQVFRRRFRGGGDGDDDDARVAIPLAKQRISYCLTDLTDLVLLSKAFYSSAIREMSDTVE